MGNARSIETNHEEDVWWSNGDTQEDIQQSISLDQEDALNTNIDQKTLSESTAGCSERELRKREMEADLAIFKQELARKHQKRRQLIVEKKKEMVDLREELVKEKEENERLRRLLEENRPQEVKSKETDVPDVIAINSIKEENEELRNEVDKLKLILREKDVIADKNKELRISLAELQKELQNVNTQIISFEKERIDYQEHVTALKDIVRVTKEMLRVRESQIEELKKKITSIEELLASKEISILSDDLRQEYERQLRNIRDLRALYEDRQRVDRREKQNLQTQIEELKKSVEDEQKKNGELTERVTELEEDNSKKYDKIVGLESNLGFSKAESKDLHAEMDVINQLFSQILITFNNDQDIDLEKMIKILEENHDLLTNIVTNDESTITSALPKVLLDLINQVNENKKENGDIPLTDADEEPLPQPEKAEKLDTIKEEEEIQLTTTHQLNSPEEIVENLPKVWRVLIELLSHQSPTNNEIGENKGEADNHCYKSVETPTGLRKVLSVSKTFIRLKSLILEKKSLEKEMTRLKQLNTHLEGRLSDQEKRLVLVSNELSKTWNFVGKMQKQHQQLHTQEKILRYELAQKRKLLTELKEELEYCRQKWSEARKQNSSTEEQWKQLRTEFASRKTSIADDINNSVESGYSDDKSSSDDEEPDLKGKKNSELEPESKTKEDAQQNTNSNGELITEGTTVDQVDTGNPMEQSVSERSEERCKLDKSLEVVDNAETQDKSSTDSQEVYCDGKLQKNSELEPGLSTNENAQQNTNTNAECQELITEGTKVDQNDIQADSGHIIEQNVSDTSEEQYKLDIPLEAVDNEEVHSPIRDKLRTNEEEADCDGKLQKNSELELESRTNEDAQQNTNSNAECKKLITEGTKVDRNYIQVVSGHTMEQNVSETSEEQCKLDKPLEAIDNEEINLATRNKSSTNDGEADFDGKLQKNSELESESRTNEDAQQNTNSNAECQELLTEESKAGQNNFQVDSRHTTEQNVSKTIEEQGDADKPLDVDNEETHSDTREVLSTDFNSSDSPPTSQIKDTDITQGEDQLQDDGFHSLANLDEMLCKQVESQLVHDEHQHTSEEPSRNNLFRFGTVQTVISTPLTGLDSAKDTIQTTCDELSGHSYEESACSSTATDVNSQTDKPSTSHKNPAEAAAEFAARREEKMKRLEGQCKDLYFSVAKTSLRGLVMSNKLDNLHEMYGEQSENTVEVQPSVSVEATEQEDECQSSPVTDLKDEKNNQE